MRALKSHPKFQMTSFLSSFFPYFSLFFFAFFLSFVGTYNNCILSKKIRSPRQKRERKKD